MYTVYCTQTVEKDSGTRLGPRQREHTLSSPTELGSMSAPSAIVSKHFMSGTPSLTRHRLTALNGNAFKPSPGRLYGSRQKSDLRPSASMISPPCVHEDS
jgi:hypothetical protein